MVAWAPFSLIFTKIQDAPVDPARRAAALEHYEKNVRPVLAERCYKCHGPESRNPKGGLRVDTRDGLLTGGDLGPAIVAGDANGSLLVKAIRYVDRDLEMPPSRKLPDEQIAAIEAWIRDGAVTPDVAAAPPLASHTQSGVPESGTASRTAAMPAGDPAALEAGRAHWAFQTYTKPAVPVVAHAGAIKSDLDAFIVAKLESAGLTPSPEADARTWLRRTTMDLTGLPPKREELQQFLAEDPAVAKVAAVDRLLASPAYGERMGRMWLDVARYADSNGLDENLAIGNAHRYRDYVIASFQQDKPFDRFILEQLAGDLLPEPASAAELRDQLTGTGFLVLGPKMLAEQDKEKLLMDTVDEQLDVAGKAFLGLTIGCARCHDHKFDPIPQSDYYALAGVFRSTSTFENTGFVSRWRENELATPAQKKERDAFAKSDTEARNRLNTQSANARIELRRQWLADFAKYMVRARALAARSIMIEAEDMSRGTLGIDRETWGNESTVIVRSTMGGPQYAEYDVTVPHGGRYQLTVQMASAEARPMRLSLNGTPRSEPVLGNITGSFHPDGQQWVDACIIELKPGRNTVRIETIHEAPAPHLNTVLIEEVDITAAGADSADSEVVRQFQRYLQHGARTNHPFLEIWSRCSPIEDARFPAAAAVVWSALRSERARGLLKSPPALLALLDGDAPQSMLDLATRYQAVLGTVDSILQATPGPTLDTDAKPVATNPSFQSLRNVLEGMESPFRIPELRMETLFTSAQKAEIASAREAVKQLEARRPKPIDRAPGVKDDKVVDLPIHIRGSHLTKGKEATPRGALRVLNHALPAPVMPAAQSGRLELARWIADPRNPLTARVIVNRIWQIHFGTGLVASSSNFGLRGDAPTHPELLNWLAATFVEEGWSIKKLQRRILLSGTYGMSSAPRAKELAADPRNQLLWRQNLRRLDAESIRDSMLAVSGRLDRKSGGTLLTTNNGDYVTNDQSADEGRYSTPRRSVYLPIIRNAMYDLFTSFDYNDSSVPVDRRPATTAAHQSLFLANSPLAFECADALATSIASVPGDEAARIEELWERVLLRKPSARELERAVSYLAEAARIDSGATDTVTAGQSPAAEPRRKDATPPPAAVPGAPWRGLCQALLASNEFLFVD